ncbi:hypothetical protein E2C01_080816 [Portunus trituberculatus]|uniref:Uncharacterized protein n=1 Tax=Portunus trituberculatus TaxID=210409 RepID=A0A5B7J0L3_PORTR|nr:hypothetical protein [Portunus trituberculatus]
MEAASGCGAVVLWCCGWGG